MVKRAAKSNKPSIVIKFHCPVPSCKFTAYRYNLMDQHAELTHKCRYCGETVEKLSTHTSNCPQRGSGRAGFVNDNSTIDQTVFKESQHSLRGVLYVYKYTVPLNEDIYLVAELIHSVYGPLEKLLSQLLDQVNGMRVSFRIIVDLWESCSQQLLKDRILGCFWSFISHKSFINSVILNSTSCLINVLDTFSETGSDIEVVRISALEVHFAEYSGSVGKHFIPLPNELKGRHGLVNIKNTVHKNSCLELCLLSAKYRDEIVNEFTLPRQCKISEKQKILYKLKCLKNPTQCEKESILCLKKEITKLKRNLAKCVKDKLERESTYKKYIGSLNLPEIFEMNGVALPELDEVESRTGCSITVYKNDGKKIYIVRPPDKILRNHVNLLLLENETTSHYVLIHDLSVFLHHGGKHFHVYCVRCLKAYQNEHTLKMHVCGERGDFVQFNPAKKDIFSFTKLEMSLYFPFCVYLYVELMDIYDDIPAQNMSGPTRVAKRVPIGYSVAVVDENLQIIFRETYRGEDALSCFFTWIPTMLSHAVDSIENTNEWKDPTAEQWTRHLSITNCEVCGVEFSEKNPPQFDHNHRKEGYAYLGDATNGEERQTVYLAGSEPATYRGTLCRTCNLAKHYPKMLPVVFMSKSRHDFKLLIKEACRCVWPTRLLPHCKTDNSIVGLEIYASDGVIKIKDLRNFQQGASLCSQTREQIASNETFQYLQDKYSEKYKDLINLLQDGQFSFPLYKDFESMDDEFEQDIFPPYSKFERNTEGDEMTRDDYDRNLKLFKLLNDPTLGNYYNHIMDIKCLLIASIFEKYRQVNLAMFGLDPVYSFSSSAYNFHCAFYFEKASVEYVKSTEMMKMIRKSVAGGLTTLNKNVAKSNLQEYGGEFDESKDRVKLVSFDLQSSYAYALAGDLPVGDYTFLSDEELASFNYKHPAEAGTGYFFECCLTLPDEFHSKFEQLVPVPERMQVKVQDLSNLQKVYMHENHKKQVEIMRQRLLLNLYDKENQVYYYKYLAFLLQEGYVLKKVTRGFSFTEKKVFAKYIKYNLEQKAKASSPFLARQYKASYCCLGGRLLVDDLKNYADRKLVYTSVEGKRHIASHRFKNVEIISKDVSLFQMKKLSGADHNLIIMGSVVLFMSKLNMLQKYYKGLKSVFKSSIEVLTFNTDGGVFSIIDNDRTFLSKMNKLKDIFYFGNLPETHPLYSKHNDTVPGVWKICSDSITEFLGLKATCYSLKIAGEVDDIKCSGLEKSAAKKYIRHEHFRQTLNTRKDGQKVQVKCIKYEKDDLIVIKTDRISLSGLDLTRFRISNHASMPFGHHLLRNVLESE